MPLTGMDGDLGAMALYSGQSVGLVHDVLPAAQIIAGIVAGAAAILR
jgi:nitronate monooxygenase/enoyl-[acyl-carrier protein] reductase II